MGGGGGTTVLCACNATGYYIPPMMIKRKTNKPELTDRAPVGSIMDSGWITSELFMDFMEHFSVHARCSPDNPHTKCLTVIDFAISKGIYLLSLPPHVTNKLQPLDRSFFKSLKAYFNNACQRWMRNHPGRCIKTKHLGELLKEAYLKAATPENAGSGFRNSGIVPFNPHVIPDHQVEFFLRLMVFWYYFLGMFPTKFLVKITIIEMSKRSHVCMDSCVDILAVLL